MVHITELEKRMRPGAWSRGGFLGPTESLESVINQDAQIVKRCGISYENIANILEKILSSAAKHSSAFMSFFPDLDAPESVPHFDLNRLPPITAGCIIDNLQIFTVGFLGVQECPWGCKASGAFDFLILNRQTGESITGPSLVTHLIREHHFFEGKESPYRTDPAKLLRVLEVC
jgi:hypothetical protein